MFPDLLTILFYGLLFLPDTEKNKVSHHEKPWLSRDVSSCMKGWFALMIIFHHLSQRTHDGFVFRHFLFIGVFCVSCFLFYSGYGLMKNCMSRENYERHFLKRRILPVLLPFVIYHILLWFAYLYEGTVYTFTDFVSLLAKGEPMAVFSWYVYFILLFYLVFCLLMKITGKNPRKMIAGALLFDVLYIIFCAARGFGIWWYDTAHIIVFGMYYAAYEEKCDAWITTHRKWLLPVCMFLVISLCALPYILPWHFQLPVYLISTCAFTVMMIALLMKHDPSNPVLRFLGSISYELYLVHELFILLFRGNHLYMNGDFLWTLSVIVCSVLLAYLFQRALRPLLAKLR